jgi:multiple sugar transport system substrate-binding protein
MKKVMCLILLGVCLLMSSISQASPVKINYYLWDDPTYKNIVEAFNRSQKEVFVNAIYLPAGDYSNKLTTILAGGSNVDAYMMKTPQDTYTYYKNGFVEPLDKYIKKYKYDTKALGGYLTQATIKKKVVGIPFRGAGYYTYYNKKLFAKAGIPTPDVYVQKGEWTWKKFYEVAKKLSSGDGKIYGAYFHTWTQCSLMPFMQTFSPVIDNKGKIIVHDKKFLASLRLRKKMEQEKIMPRLVDLLASRLHYSKAFYDGNVAMMPMGEWFPGMMLKGKNENLLRNYDWNDWGLTRLPCDEKKYVNIGVSLWNHIYPRSNNKDAAFKFIAWIGSAETAPVIAENGFMPAVITNKVRESLTSSIPDAESIKYYLDPSPRAVAWYTSPYGTQVETLLGNYVSKYMNTNNVKEKEFMTAFRNELKKIAKSNP